MDKKGSLDSVEYERLLNVLKNHIECLDMVQSYFCNASEDILLLLKETWFSLAKIQTFKQDAVLSKTDDVPSKIDFSALSDTELQESVKKQVIFLFDEANYFNSNVWLPWVENHINVLLLESDKLTRDYKINVGKLFWTKKRIFIAQGIAAFSFILCIFLCCDFFTEKPWKASYYTDPNLRGQAKLTRNEANLSLSGKTKLNKMVGEVNVYSIRFETCINVKKEQQVNLSLASDDGSRFFLDNHLAIDNWGAHSIKVEQKRVLFREGMHKLTVEYNDFGGGAELSLASDPIDFLDAENLSQPAADGKCY